MSVVEPIKSKTRKKRISYQSNKSTTRIREEKPYAPSYRDIQAHKAAWTEHLMKQDLGYFMTITFNSYAHRNPDEDIKRVLSYMNDNLYGNRHRKRKGGQIAGFLVREENVEGKSHYHMLINKQERLKLESIAKALIYASRCCNSLHTMTSKDLKKIISNKRQQSVESSTEPAKIMKEALFGHEEMFTNKVHVNVQQILSEEDKKRLINYIIKKIYRNGFRNYFPFSDSPKDYYNFSTVY